MSYRRPNYNEPIEGEVCGMPIEAYALACQLLHDDGAIGKREYKQLCSYVELSPDNPKFAIEMPKIVNAACARWLKEREGKELDEEDAEMRILVERLQKTTDEEIRRAVS